MIVQPQVIAPRTYSGWFVPAGTKVLAVSDEGDLFPLPPTLLLDVPTDQSIFPIEQDDAQPSVQVPGQIAQQGDYRVALIELVPDGERPQSSTPGRWIGRAYLQNVRLIVDPD